MEKIDEHPIDDQSILPSSYDWNPQKCVPVRPKPVWTSSARQRIPFDWRYLFNRMRFSFDNQSRFTRMFSSNIVLDKQSVHHRIVMFQWEIKLFDDHEILLLLLFDEYHRDIIDRFSLRRSCNQYHDIFLGKHPVYRSEKWEDFCPQIDLHAYHLRYEHVPVLFSRICISWIHR